ncbi:hypothetical protein O4J55_08475 [Paracoccus sp. PXZ]
MSSLGRPDPGSQPQGKPGGARNLERLVGHGSVLSGLIGLSPVRHRGTAVVTEWLIRLSQQRLACFPGQSRESVVPTEKKPIWTECPNFAARSTCPWSGCPKIRRARRKEQTACPINNLIYNNKILTAERNMPFLHLGVVVGKR